MQSSFFPQTPLYHSVTLSLPDPPPPLAADQTTAITIFMLPSDLFILLLVGSLNVLQQLLHLCHLCSSAEDQLLRRPGLQTLDGLDDVVVQGLTRVICMFATFEMLARYKICANAKRGGYWCTRGAN